MAKVKPFASHPFFLLGMGAILSFFSVWVYIHKSSRLSKLEENAFFLKTKVAQLEEKNKKIAAIETQMRLADPGYMENALEKMAFLETETYRLQVLVQANPSLSEDTARLQKIQKNNLRLKQKNFQRVGKLQEVEVLQENPVEMNASDLKQFLANVENTTIGNFSPQGHPPCFTIKYFEMQKKPLPSDEEIFVIKCKLSKQEMIHE